MPATKDIAECGQIQDALPHRLAKGGHGDANADLVARPEAFGNRPLDREHPKRGDLLVPEDDIALKQFGLHIDEINGQRRLGRMVVQRNGHGHPRWILVREIMDAESRKQREHAFWRNLRRQFIVKSGGG